jgi:hypothetical protein
MAIMGYGGDVSTRAADSPASSFIEELSAKKYREWIVRMYLRIAEKAARHKGMK